MLAILISWICIFTVFITTGEIICRIYNKITHRYERYGIAATVMLGMGVTSAILCFISLFLAVNQYILFALLTGSVLYQATGYKNLIRKLKDFLVGSNKLLLTAYFLLGLGFMLFPVWTFSVKLDPFIYHYNNVMWNETYPVVAGLANLDEKFGFNSDYFLLQSCFSLRFLFDEVISGLPSLLAFIIAADYLNGIVTSKFDPKKIVLFFVYFILVFVVRNDLTELSTDIIPTLIIFYLFSKIIADTETIKHQTLFCVLIPVSLISFKLSAALICFVCLWSLYTLFGRKKYKAIAALLSVSVIVTLPWLIRNVIISGYLIFPLYQLDLFSFDWKVPIEVVKSQKDFIHDYATQKMLRLIHAHDPTNDTLLLLISCCIAATTGAYHIARKRTAGHIIIFSVLIVNILFWALSAPDIRFGYGYIFAMILFAVHLLIPEKIPLKTNVCIVILFSFSAIWTAYGFRWASKYTTFLGNYAYTTGGAWKEALTQPVRLKFLMDRELKREDERFNEEKEFTFIPHTLNNNIIIYVSSSRLGFTFDKIPAVSDCRINTESVFHDFRKIEARGKQTEDGFRHK